jgi:hypothetical protein
MKHRSNSGLGKAGFASKHHAAAYSVFAALVFLAFPFVSRGQEERFYPLLGPGEQVWRASSDRPADGDNSPPPKTKYTGIEYVYYDGNPVPDKVTLLRVPNTGIRQYAVPDGVTDISNGAFSEFMGGYSYNDTSYLESVTLPDSVKKIDEHAFFDVHTLKSVSLPAHVSIGRWAFHQCSHLETIEFRKDPSGAAPAPGSVVFDAEAFPRCYSLKHFEFPDGIEVIPENVFNECGKLESVVIPDGVKILREKAFYGCKSLKRIRIPDSVERIESGAFGYCSALEEIEINTDRPGLVILGGAFRNTSLKHFKIPPGTKTVGGMFGNCKSLESVEIPDGVEIIDAGAFYGCESLKQIRLPDSVKEIGDSAFEGCRNMRMYPALPAGLRKIGAHAFFGCEQVKSAILPGALTELGNAFDLSATKLRFLSPAKRDARNGVAKRRFRFTLEGALIDTEKNVLIGLPPGYEGDFEIPDGIRAIGPRAFENCRVGSVTMPASVTSLRVGERMFYNCPNLKRAVLSESLSEIPRHLFEECVSLEEVALPSKITEIGANMFRNCRSLKRIEIPSGVRSIHNGAFNGCSSLEEIALPEKLNELRGGSVFEGCSSLKRIELPAGIRSIPGSTFSGCTGLKQVTLPEKLHYIGSEAFKDCRSLEQIAIPSGVEQIEPDAFEGAACEAYIKEHFKTIIFFRYYI